MGARITFSDSEWDVAPALIAVWTKGIRLPPTMPTPRLLPGWQGAGSRWKHRDGFFGVRGFTGKRPVCLQAAL
jgi:hypothetical protein